MKQALFGLGLLGVMLGCRDNSTGVWGTFAVSGNVSNHAGLAVADLEIEVRLLYPTCMSGSVAQGPRPTRTSATGLYVVQFAEMYDGCARVVATPSGGTPVVVDFPYEDVRVGDNLIVNVKVP